jgi:Flp pilus assembly protein CpaB
MNMNKQNIVRISIVAGVAILVAGVVGVKMYAKAQDSVAAKVETVAPAIPDEPLALIAPQCFCHTPCI